ncbi:LON peptidase substrate-binding domain-containing protein [Deinococcus sp. Leaf326]|uniref:LON peptidase substrate-binding domain-containing protein n=1 Tax=Deinococcus sp. Leaf326 TaxID=1736338 RepID=UPI0006F4DD19|nr:LON peptidase substrate-binding domain-containing protein [Deinococcus sp. Leaf326]KQR40644.1 peptidase S16 [Deinococcus sp. Leaf326]
MSVPLFPLPNVVLFPDQRLPLYIFEPRYRELLRRVQETGEPFGVVRILRPGAAQGEALTGRVSPVGTLAHLRWAETHDDGTSSVEVEGGERFRVRSFDTSQSYLAADIEAWPLEQPAADSQAISGDSVRLLAGLMRVYPQEAELIREHAPAGALRLASYAAALLPLSAEQREEALEALNLRARIAALLAALPPAPELN